MSLSLGIASVLLSSLLLLSIIGSRVGGIPGAFGQSTFLSNFTASDIDDVADDITDKVEEQVREEVEDIINLPLPSGDNYNDENNNRNIDGNNSSTIISPPSLMITSTPTVMINEIELNPPGQDDEGKEWIELFNPSAADINIGNFEIRTSSGSATIKLSSEAIVEAGNTYVIILKDGLLSNIVESLVLVDATGGIKDRTPSLVDRSDDDRTWQRIPDGSNEWQFLENTQGSLNDPDYRSNNNSSSTDMADSENYQADSGIGCLDSAGCIEGITTRVVNADTLYVIGNGSVYKVNLALVEASSNTEERLVESTEFTQDLCLGSPTIVDQDDNLVLSQTGSSIIAVVYCSSSNLNKELLDNGYAELDMLQCATSEFANEEWAKEHGC